MIQHELSEMKRNDMGCEGRSVGPFDRRIFPVDIGGGGLNGVARRKLTQRRHIVTAHGGTERSVSLRVPRLLAIGHMLQRCLLSGLRSALLTRGICGRGNVFLCALLVRTLLGESESFVPFLPVIARDQRFFFGKQFAKPHARMPRKPPGICHVPAQRHCVLEARYDRQNTYNISRLQPGTKSRFVQRDSESCQSGALGHALQYYLLRGGHRREPIRNLQHITERVTLSYLIYTGPFDAPGDGDSRAGRPYQNYVPWF